MATEDIRYEGRRVFPHSAVMSPKFATPSVLASDPWAYARLHLIQKGQTDAAYYWDQAREFFSASKQLSVNASTLTSYYCLLNATKTLLLSRCSVHASLHGTSGAATAASTDIGGEECTIQKSGILPALMRLYGVTVTTPMKFTLRELLYVIPYVHRAYILTFRDDKDLFIPLETPRFVAKAGSNEAWFTATIPASQARPGWSADLHRDFEHDTGIVEYTAVRSTRRFAWEASNLPSSLARLCRSHVRLRKWLIPIVAPTNRWYLRRTGARAETIPLLAATFAALHRLSELSRYEAMSLHRHLQGQEGWLLSEFLQLAPAQYVSTIASEITGMEFIRPDAVRL